MKFIPSYTLISLLFFAQSFNLSHLMAQRAYTGIWLQSTDKGHIETGISWQELQSKHEELSHQGLQLTDIETDRRAGPRTYTAVWQEGEDTTVFFNHLQYEKFYEKWQELSAQDLRLIDIETYVEGKQRFFIGIYRSGTDKYSLWGGGSWKLMYAQWKKLARQDLRLIDVETYVEDGVPKYLGVWREGEYAQYFWGGAEWYSFSKKIETLAKDKFNLIDYETFHDGESRKYLGVWSEDSLKYYLWNEVDEESFQAKWKQLDKYKLALIDIEQYAGCESSCDNQIVANKPYSLSLKRHQTTYHWPVDNKDSIFYARLSAITFSERFLYLPFTTNAHAQLAKTWADNQWAYGMSYTNENNNSFRVRAMAEGTVIYATWDPQLGNTLIISHDYKGRKDVFRTIYTQLRNGAISDCEKAWAYSIPTLNPQARKAYQQYLSACGCPKNPKLQKPKEQQWGTEKNIIPRLRGKKVNAGEFLGWAGTTGASAVSEKGLATPPTLQIFVTRREKNGDKWFLVDPYGIYAKRDCYPSNITGRVDISCRYSQAWHRNRPQFPQLKGLNMSN